MIAVSFRRRIAAQWRSMSAFMDGNQRQTRVIDGSASTARRSAMGSSVSYSREEEGGSALEVQRSTVRGQDKRPQGAARSVACFRSRFSCCSQGLVSARNVREVITPLSSVAFAHIAEAGDG
jgi:hypothetical protein